MSVACPKCGRGYDVALFQFGRTLHCACGARVGRELRAVGAEPGPPRFVADVMLGRLARWLRVLGYDTAYDAGASDEALAKRAVREGRILLTRDRRLPQEWWIEPVLVLDGEDPLEQLGELVRALGLRPDAPLFTRCLVCNTPLTSAAPDAVRLRVPERVRRQQSRFAACPDCARIYWEGSHTARMRRALARALAEPPA